MSNIDKINQEYKDYLSDLETQSLHIKYNIDFDADLDKIFEILSQTTIDGE